MAISKNQLAKSLLIGAGAILATRMLVRRSRYFSYEGKVVAVAGGSRGLGLVLARRLLEKGAKLAICARNAEEVARAVEDLKQYGDNVAGVPCDISSEKKAAKFINDIVGWWGRIDVLFNVAGIIQVGPIEAMTTKDFNEAMQINCFGHLHTALAAIPHMRKQNWGRIVNIASLGGKRAVPHMLPYSASKFALVGLSSGMRTELKKDGILVTVICPGLMRTGSPRNATFKGQVKKEFAWFNISDSMPFITVSAESAAKKIMKACQSGVAECGIGSIGNLGMVSQLAPSLTAEVLSLVNYLLPKMGGIGKKSAKGYESESWISPSFLTTLGNRAAARNNELVTTD